ncbi:MAG: hypothetical protein GEU99_03240 [Luteitalea sp.]|nr:hypothetical protein [Luteitalea sp.]
MTPLLPEQADALRALQRVCDELGIDVVVIGAIALRVWILHEYRVTEDIDVAVALDLDELQVLTVRLAFLGWRPDQRWEPRWHSPHGARVDLLPIGLRARQKRQVVWPRAETTMRVLGYEHVFQDATVHELEPGLRMRVPPLPVLALLKIVAYVDEPATRQKDLEDILVIIDTYEEDTERRFSDEVLDAGIQYDEAGAFLLGRDLQARCTSAYEADVVRRFLGRVSDPDFQLPAHVARRRVSDEEGAESMLGRQLAALARGFG